MLFHFYVPKSVASAIVDGRRTFDVCNSSYEIQPGDTILYACENGTHDIEDMTFIVTYVASHEDIPGLNIISIRKNQPCKE